jgi:putative ABC transport system permease protein
MENLVTANIRSRPTRTFISILAVALGVILLLVVGGMVKGTLDDVLNRTMSMGADFILQPSGSSFMYAFSDNTLNEKYAEVLQQTPGVEAVTPVLAKFHTKYFGLVFGIDWASYSKFPGRLQIIEGKSSLKDDEIIIDQSFAEAKKLKIGMTMEVKDHIFTISAICRPGSVVRVYVPLETMKKIYGNTDKVTIMFIKAAPKANVDQVYHSLRTKFAGFSLLKASDPSLLLAEAPLPGLGPLRIMIVVVSMLLAFMIILLAMYTTIFERTREIGILKALGASRSFIVGMILKESVMICGLGVILGIIASEAIRILIILRYPTFQIAMGVGDLTKGIFLGLLAGILGALYPAYKAAKMDPVKALSYE